jgi:hypothetical protein
MGTATAWRYVSETAALLAARSPKLHKTLRKAITTTLPVYGPTAVRPDHGSRDGY